MSDLGTTYEERAQIAENKLVILQRDLAAMTAERDRLARELAEEIADGDTLEKARDDFAQMHLEEAKNNKALTAELATERSRREAAQRALGEAMMYIEYNGGSSSAERSRDSRWHRWTAARDAGKNQP